MTNRNLRLRTRVAPAEITAACLDRRDDGLLDAVLTVAALVAGADGRIEPVERGQLLDFLDRNEVLSVFTRAEMLDAFERRLRELREPGGAAAAVRRLRRYAGHPPARLVVDAGEEVAAADCRLDPRERRILHLIRLILRPPRSPSVRAFGRSGAVR
jgi:tellurite resistance protein